LRLSGSTERLTAVVALTVMNAARLSPPLAMVLGLVSWGFFTGLVVNQHAELTLRVLDVVRLGVLLACAAAAHWVR
jgi:predicted ABC-type sugar transport system permease subunit